MNPITRVDDFGRECTGCGEYKSWDNYCKGSGAKGHSPTCQSCKSIARINTPNSTLRGYCNKYEKTRKGFLMRAYRNMKSRVSGVQWRKNHLYGGKQLLGRDEFYSWANSSLTFHILFSNWEKSGYDRKICPSVDRINPDDGYKIENMEWVTLSENSRRSAVTRKRA